MILKRHLGKEEFTVQDIGQFLKKMLDRFEDDKFTSTTPKGRRFLKAHRPASSSRNKAFDTTDTEAEEEALQFQRPYKQLMIWAVLLNRCV